jgi:cobalt-zinc-cadmium efflux system outer membrane protein
MRLHFKWPALAGIFILSGCAIAPRDRGAGEVDGLLAGTGAPAVSWPGAGDSPAPTGTPGEVLSLRRALELAFSRSPVVAGQYAELGLSTAGRLDAVKLPDLGLEYSRLAFPDGHGQTTRGVSLALADLLLLPARARLANEEGRITRERVAARFARLEAEVSRAWFDAVAARQAAAVRASSARAARVSADYAQRLHEAGNLPARALALERAAASRADIAAARARVAAIEARAMLGNLAGIPVRDDWQVPAGLPALPHHDATLGPRADPAESRPDVAAARREVTVLERAWRIARTWRWLGEFDVGYESESEHGETLRGPTFHLRLPLFHWNRGGVLRARARLESAQAALRALELETANEIAVGQDRLATAREIAEQYRGVLLPQNEAVSARTLEEVNFMLAGAFEALAARREQFAAYVEYVEAVRDYWRAHVDLRLATGGALPPPAITELLDLDARPVDVTPDHGAPR